MDATLTEQIARWHTIARLQNAIEGLKTASATFALTQDEYWQARINEWEIIIAQCLDLLDK